MHLGHSLLFAAYALATLAVSLRCARRRLRESAFFLADRRGGWWLQWAAVSSVVIALPSVRAVGGASILMAGPVGLCGAPLLLLIAPCFWVVAVWYRRLRCVTLADWFAQRYASQALGAACAVLCWLMLLALSCGALAALGRLARQCVDIAGPACGAGMGRVDGWLLLATGAVVAVGGALGGLRAILWAGALHAGCLLSAAVLWGGWAAGNAELLFLSCPDRTTELSAACRGTLAGLPSAGVGLVLLVTLCGLQLVVVQPQLLVLSGGMATGEAEARWAAVLGLFVKALSTVVLGSALGLVAGTLAAGSGCGNLESPGPAPLPTSIPTPLWGMALAALLAMMMSVVGVCMLVASALVTRNLYVPFCNPHASEACRVAVGRVAGVAFVAIALFAATVPGSAPLGKQALVAIPSALAPPLLAGLCWRGATRFAAWCTLVAGTTCLLIAPVLLPQVLPGLRDDPRLLTCTRWVGVMPAGVPRCEPDPPAPLVRGGRSLFWSEGVHPAGRGGRRRMDVAPVPVGVPRVRSGVAEVALRYPSGTRRRGYGMLQVELLPFPLLGVDIRGLGDATAVGLLCTSRLVCPWLLMVVVSLLSRRCAAATLDRQLARLRTPARHDDDQDRARLVSADASPEQLEREKWLPGTDCDLPRPNWPSIFGLAAWFAVGYVLLRLLSPVLG